MITNHKTIKWKNPQHHGYPLNGKARLKTIVNLGKSQCHQQHITKKPHACTMRAKTNKEIIHVTCYLQSNLVVAADPTIP